MDSFLQATTAIDCDHPQIQELAYKTIDGARDVHEKARRLFLYVRDSIAYNPYSPFFLIEHYKATTTLRRGRGYCVQKSVVLVALARAAEIPTRLVFADIRNYMTPKRLADILGTTTFTFHGYVEWLLSDRWVRVTPTFGKALCQEQGYPLVEFNGQEDAVFPTHDAEGRRFVEYVRHHGTFADVPLDLILEGWNEVYGKERVQEWKGTFRE